LDASKPKSLANWKEKKELPYMLLSDPDKKLIGFFGAKKAGAGSGIVRSHVFVAKGGLVEEVNIKVCFYVKLP
jgi:peroxiredoxin Q/BCP